MEESLCIHNHNMGWLEGRSQCVIYHRTECPGSIQSEKKPNTLNCITLGKGNDNSQTTTRVVHMRKRIQES